MSSEGGKRAGQVAGRAERDKAVWAEPLANRRCSLLHATFSDRAA